MLEIDGHRLTQSLAICDYLDPIFPEPPFMPRDPADGAHVLAMALTVACDIHPLNNLRVLKYLKGALGHSQDGERRLVSPLGRPKGWPRWRRWPAPRAGAFLFGDAPTIADICLVPQLYNARRFSVPLDAYPTLRRADETASAHRGLRRRPP